MCAVGFWNSAPEGESGSLLLPQQMKPWRS